MELDHINTLLINVGLEVGCVFRNDRYTVDGWVVWSWDGDMSVNDDSIRIRVYQHKRSMMRAAWRLYRQRTGD